MREDETIDLIEVGDRERIALSEALGRLSIRPAAVADYEDYGEFAVALSFSATIEFLMQYLSQGLESARNLVEFPPEDCPYESYGCGYMTAGPSKKVHDKILVDAYVTSTWEGKEMRYGEAPLVVCRTATDHFFVIGPSLDELRSWPDRWRIDEGDDDDDFDEKEHVDEN